jgi:tellurite resistance protein
MFNSSFLTLPYCRTRLGSISCHHSFKGRRFVNTHPPSLSSQDCLVAVMIAVSASDENIRTAELMSIQAIVNHLPIFGEYDVDRIKSVAAMVLDLLSEEDGLDALFGLIRDRLPDGLNETAYAMACDVAAADGKLGQIELRMLQEIRHELEVDRLHGAAIEAGARARFRTLT